MKTKKATEEMNQTLAVQRLAKIVKDSRQELNCSEKEYARLFGTTHPSISNIENAHYISLPNHTTLIQIAKIKGITYSELIGALEGAEIKPRNEQRVEKIKTAIAKVKSQDKLLDLLDNLN